MAVKIRCDECHKRISIDEAFIGGVCRCPYCKAIVPVVDDGMPSGGPVERAETPTEPSLPDESAGTASMQATPTAAPIKLQGVLTIVILLLLLAMIAGGIYMFVAYVNREKDEPSDSKATDSSQEYVNGDTDGTVVAAQENPFEVKPDAGEIAGIKLDSPVIYIIDGGSSMQEMFDYAISMARVSILSLRSDQKFSLMVLIGEKCNVLPGGNQQGGKAGDAAAREFLLGLSSPFGATDLEGAIKTAISQKPGMIVVLARKPLDNAKALAAQAKAAGVRVATISLDADSEVDDSFAELASGSGGESAKYSFSKLQTFDQSVPSLE